MRQVHFFRWLLTGGLTLITCSLGVYIATPDFPELQQVDLTVLDEKPDGRCTVRWENPFGHGEREAPYLCDPERSSTLKAPHYNPETGFGWETGCVIAEGPDKGELYSLEEDGDDREEQLDLSDALLAIGLPLTVVALAGESISRLLGNTSAPLRSAGAPLRGISALNRGRKAAPKVVREARRLQEAATLVVQDHQKAVEAVRTAWVPLHRELVDGEPSRTAVTRLREEAAGVRAPVRELKRSGLRTVQEVLDAGEWRLRQIPGVGRSAAERVMTAARRIADEVHEDVAVRIDATRPEPRTTALVTALQVLVEAGPGVRHTMETGRELTARLEPLPADAAPAAGWWQMFRAGEEERHHAREAVAELRALLAEAEQAGVARRFRQASVDLLRGPDSGPSGLSAWVDFGTRPSEYYDLLAQAVDPGRPAAGHHRSGRSTGEGGPGPRRLGRR